MAVIENDIVKETKTAAPKKTGLVEIRVPRSEIGESNYMIIGDNGKYYKLKRGEVVKVPQSVADIIEESEDRKESARAYLEELINK